MRRILLGLSLAVCGGFFSQVGNCSESLIDSTKSSTRWLLGSVLQIQDNGVVLFNVDDEEGFQGLGIFGVCLEKTPKNRTHCTDLLATWENELGERVVQPIKGSVYGNDFEPDHPDFGLKSGVVVLVEEDLDPQKARPFSEYTKGKS